jgi:hypothetical protein
MVSARKSERLEADVLGRRRRARLHEAALVGEHDRTEDGEGELIGSGDGSVAAPAIAGQLAWTLFERPGKLVCAMTGSMSER